MLKRCEIWIHQVVKNGCRSASQNLKVVDLAEIALLLTSHRRTSSTGVCKRNTLLELYSLGEVRYALIEDLFCR